jgi:hypothetical protein
VSYAFGPNETISFSDGNIETITGGFSVNLPVTQFGLTADVTLAGAGPESGTYSAIETDGPSTIVIGNSGAFMSLSFASDFGVNLDGLILAVWTHTVFPPNQFTGFTTTAVASAVPEIKTWAMMLLGFAGIGFMAYRRKSKPSLMVA